MTMTIEVYRINPGTGVRTQVRPLRTIEAADVPELFDRFPPCACPPCRSRKGVPVRAQVVEVNGLTGGTP